MSECFLVLRSFLKFLMSEFESGACPKLVGLLPERQLDTCSPRVGLLVLVVVKVSPREPDDKGY